MLCHVFWSQVEYKIVCFILESSEASTPNARWDYIKDRMRQFSKKFSIDNAKKRKAKRLELESKVKELEEQLTTTSNDQLINDYIIINARRNFNLYKTI